MVLNARKEKAMIARFDHRPRLTALLALSTAVLFVVVITLATLLITSAPAVSPSSVGDGGNPADLHGKVVAAEAHKGMDAGGEKYGNYDYYSHQPVVVKPAQTGNGADSAIDRHAEVVAAYTK
jgi:hypothetical protein